MYQIKLYSRTKVFKKVINPSIIKNRISFSANINWGQGMCRLQLDTLITNTDYIIGDIIEVYGSNSGSLILIYTWYISEINRNVTDYEEIELVCRGLASLFTSLVYSEAGDTTIVFNDDPFTSVWLVKDYINTHYNLFSLSWELFGSNINYDTNNSTCFNIIKDLAETIDYYFYVNNYEIEFKPKPTEATRTFTLVKDIVELRVDLDDTELVNRVIMHYNWWAAQDIVEDVTSQWIYWLREKYISLSNIKNKVSADEYGASYLAQYGTPIQRIKMQVNLNYNTWLLPIDSWGEIETLWPIDFIGIRDIMQVRPWEMCKIRNIKQTLSDTLLITKIDYNQETITIHLDKVENFIWLIKE